MLNAAIRDDYPEDMMHAVMIIRGMTRRLNLRDVQLIEKEREHGFPSAAVLYRGGGIPQPIPRFFHET